MAGRFLIYTLIGTLLLHVAQRLAGAFPIFQSALEQVAYGAFVPLAAACAIGLLNAKPLLPLLLGALLLTGSAWPPTLQMLAQMLLPVGAGILVGHGLRTVVHPSGTPAEPVA